MILDEKKSDDESIIICIRVRMNSIIYTNYLFSMLYTSLYFFVSVITVCDFNSAFSSGRQSIFSFPAYISENFVKYNKLVDYVNMASSVLGYRHVVLTGSPGQY